MNKFGWFEEGKGGGGSAQNIKLLCEYLHF